MTTNYIRGYMKKINIIISILICSLVLPSFNTFALSDVQKGSISTNCDTIQQTLKQLAKTDSKTRVYLGTAYEKVLTNFVTPLNLRLTKNNRPNNTLSTIQSNLASERDKFVETYTTYMKHLEEIGNIDCKTKPEEFYSRLETARSDRANLQKSALEINSLIHKHVENVTKLKDTL